jgi:hypothetical protein
LQKKKNGPASFINWKKARFVRQKCQLLEAAGIELAIKR